MESDKRLRVLQISHDYEGPFRAVCWQYASAFAGHDVTTLYVCGRYDANVVSQTGGDEVLFLEQPHKAMRGLKLGTLFKFARLFRERTFDLVIAHRYKPVYFAGIMSLFFPVPVLLAVVHEHQVFRRVARRLFIKFWRRNIICVGVSASVSRDIERYCGPLARRGRLYTLPHAMDVQRRPQLLSAGQARQRLGIPEDVYCFGTVGRLVAKKDHDVLLTAFRQFLVGRGECEAPVILVIVGAGPEEHRLRQYVSQHGMERRVVFTGHVDDAWRCMRAMDFFVLPSGSAEAFGLVLLEAMVASVPVICSDAPGPREVAGDVTLLFEAGDASALAEQLELAFVMSPEDRARLAVRANERLEAEYSLTAFETRIRAIPDIRRLALDDR